MKKHQICVIGSGYVGLVTGACMAEIGHRVVCVDSDKKKITALRAGKNPIYEPGLDRLLAANRKSKALTFATSIAEGMRSGGRDAEAIFIAVGTPPRPNGSADLSYVEAVAEEVARNLRSYAVIVDKSTVPVETGEWVHKTVQRINTQGVPFDVASNPEFLSEGSAVKDFMRPDRIILGVASSRAEALLRSVYAPIKAPVLVTDVKSAELIKHASNSFLATKISFINAVSVLCEKTGADVEKVAEGMGLDRRIGDSFLRAGIGFGGFCFHPEESAIVRDPAGVIRKLSMREAYDAVRTEGGQWEALSFDPRTNETQFQPISAVSRRPYDGLLARVSTKMGRSVRVTTDHPFLVRAGSGWTTRAASDITTSDWLPAFLSMPESPKPLSINLLSELESRKPAFFDRVLVRLRNGAPWSLDGAGRAALASTGAKPTRVHDIARRGAPLRLPEFRVLQAAGHLDAALGDLELATAKGRSTYMPAALTLTADFCRLLGYLAAEGCIMREPGLRGTRERIAFHFHEKELEFQSDVTNVLSSLGIRHAVVPVPQHRVVRITVSSRLLAFVLRDVLGCGTDSYSARVPDAVLSSPMKHRLEFLLGSLRGDGSIHLPAHSPTAVCEFGTVSRDMQEGLTALSHSLGLVPSAKTALQNKSTRPAHFLRFSGAAQVRRLAEAKGRDMGARVRERLARLNREPAPAGFKRIGGGVASVRVTAVDRETYKGHVYSLEVAETQMLASASGLFLHNCFPKDLEAFYWIAQKKGYDFKLLQAVKEINEHQKDWVARKVEEELWNLEGKRIAVLGLSFKPNTDDLRFAPSLEIIAKLQSFKVSVTAYDPVAMPKAKALLPGVRFAKDAYAAAEGADCLVLITEWPEFKELDFGKIKRAMRHPIVLDGRNLFNPKELRALGFTYRGVGRA